MSDKVSKWRRLQSAIGHAGPQTEVCATGFQKGAEMLEAEATADMLLMSQTFGTPLLAPSETVEEPVAAVLVRAVLAGDRDTFARLYEM
jgi:hypothetical protein